VWRYALGRVAQLVPTLVLVTALLFGGLRMLPGDPAEIMAGLEATPETVARLRREWGYDQPVAVQYVAYLRNLLRGNFGQSTRTFAPVSYELPGRIRATIELATAAMVIAVVLGITLGVVSALRVHSWIDYLGTATSLAGVSIPIFWSGLVLLLVFSVALRWLPAGGRGSLAHLVLPALALGAFAAGVIARQTRAAMLDVLSSDYITTARAKGLPRMWIVIRHGLRNALLPVVTLVGLQYGAMLGGSVLTENVFSWPGLGSYVVESLSARDYAAVQAAILIFAIAFATVNLLVDVSYGALDPRIRHE
jgi:peptide/nickel transport system permease protein/oligopeptide transport system permease protein